MEFSNQSIIEPRWAVPAEGSLSWESWGEQHAVFDSRSGETHLLPDLTARLLRMIITHPATAMSLAEDLCADSGEVCDKQYMQHIRHLLQQLRSVGLIEEAAQ